MGVKALAATILLLAVILTIATPIQGRRTRSRQGRATIPPRKAENDRLGPPPSYPGTDRLQIHMVSHSHEDLGWLKTVDEYYYGANNSICHAGVQYILDSLVLALDANPARRFTYVEVGFFVRWWREQTPEIQGLVKDLVAAERLVFANGGWVMHDEAVTHYVDQVDQMTLGHSFLLDTFGVSPDVGWQIDPFGHSATNANLFAEMGFNSYFFARVDYQDKEHRLEERNMQTVMRSSPSLGSAVDILAGVLFQHYSPPPGYCFDQFCTDPPIQDDPLLEGVNIAERSDGFVAYCVNQSDYYNTGNIMLTMGDDFQYENANEWYKNLDRLIGYIQANADTYNVDAFYSTPVNYTAAVYGADHAWTVDTGDFFPYADKPYAFWTGYFTSRPALKGYIRRNSNYLQTCRYYEALRNIAAGGAPSPSEPTSDALEQAMALCQHHDAVTGTEQQHVADDYALRLAAAHEECAALVSDEVAVLTGSPSQFVQCDRLNVSLCNVTQSGKALAVVIHNPIPRGRTSYVRLPVNASAWLVQDATLAPVPSQVNKNLDAPLPGRPSAAPMTLVFAADLPPLGFATFFVTSVDDQTPGASVRATIVSGHGTRGGRRGRRRGETAAPVKDVVLENEALEVTFNASTGHMTSIANRITGETVIVDQAMLWYNASAGNNINSTQASGAYIFRPNGTDPFCVNPSSCAAKVTFVNGPVVQEVWLAWGAWATQVVRLYAGAAFFETEYTVGPIDISDNLGKEVITRFDTTLVTKGLSYTDSNGREMVERQRNHRNTWALNQTEPVAGNYYPIATTTFIEDVGTNVRLTAVTDRSHGTGSIVDGSMEIMLHRRLLYDDARGVGQPLNETGITGDGLIVRGSHWMFVASGAAADVAQRTFEEQLTFQPTLSFAVVGALTPAEWVAETTTVAAGVTSSLPPNVHLQTLQWINATTVLLRLNHMYGVGEGGNMSSPVNVGLDHLFSAFDIVGVTEMSLTANQRLSDVHRFAWQTQASRSVRGSGGSEPRKTTRRRRRDVETGDEFVITLNPMDIATLYITVAAAAA